MAFFGENFVVKGLNKIITTTIAIIAITMAIAITIIITIVIILKT